MMSMPRFHQKGEWLLLGALWAVGACSSDDEAGIEVCRDFTAPDAIAATGAFSVRLLVDKARAPEEDFVSFVSDVEATSFNLVACQLDDQDRLWVFESRWFGLPEASTDYPVRVGGFAQLDAGPTTISGSLRRCQDELCEYRLGILMSFGGLSTEDLYAEVSEYSAKEGTFTGKLAGTVGPTTRAELNFDLRWEGTP